jgi:hypothetical protein
MVYEMGGACGKYGIWEMYTVFWFVNLKEMNRSAVLGIGGNIILRWILMKYDGGMGGLIWLRTETSGWLLLMR